MKPDPEIDEIRAVRRRISERFGHDLKRLFEHYKELQKEQVRFVEKDANVQTAKS